MISKRNSLWSVAFIVASVLTHYNVFADGQSYTGKQQNAPFVGGADRDFSNENLFTGDVAFSVPLVSLGGLDVSLTYNSNVHKLIRVENKVQQAGWVGLGWSLTLGSIVGDINGTRDVSDDRYYFVGPAGTSEIVLATDGQFKLKDYQYWKISRTVDANGNLLGWTITRDDGSVYRYGNYDKTTNMFSLSRTPTAGTRFSLSWNGVVANPMNNQYSGAELIPYSWDLTDVEDIYHNHTSIRYQQETDYLYVNPNSTLPMTYTRSSYPLEVMDRTGRKIEFLLGNLAQREYGHGIGLYNKFVQRQFQTKFLDKVQIKDQTLAIVQEFDFGYDTASVLSSGRVKRFLTAVIQKDPSGQAIPPTTFEYYGVSGVSAGVNTGALKKITYATGGSVSYQYSAQALSNVRLDSSKTFSGANDPNLLWTSQSRLAGSDFFATISADGSLGIYRWGAKGWYLDSGFPIATAAAIWIMQDYIVVSETETSMKVVKRKNEGWSTFTVNPGPITNSPGYIRVDGFGSNFFVVGHNYRNYNYGGGNPPTWARATEDISVVRWNGVTWEITNLGNFSVGRISGWDFSFPFFSDRAHAIVRGGVDYFVLQVSRQSNLDGESRDECHVFVRNQVTNTWSESFSFLPDPATIENDGFEFGLYAGRDYFLTYCPGPDARPDVSRFMRAYHWPFSLSNGRSWSNIEAHGSIVPGDKSFVFMAKNSAYIHTFHGYGVTSESWPYSVINAATVFGSSGMKYSRAAVRSNQVSIGWKEGSSSPYIAKLAVANLDSNSSSGQSWSGQVLSSTSFTNNDQIQCWADECQCQTNQCEYFSTSIHPVYSTTTLYGEMHFADKYDKAEAYADYGGSWIRTKLDSVGVDWLGPSSYTASGLDFVVQVTDSTSSNGGISLFARKEGYGPNLNQIFDGRPYDFPVVTKTLTNGMGVSYVTSFAYENGTYDENINFAKYNKVTVTHPGSIGETITYYYNDLGPYDAEEFVDVPNHKELDGMPYRVKVFNGTYALVSQTVNTWSVRPIDLSNGVFHRRLVQIEMTKDGITSATKYQYDDICGLAKVVTELVGVANEFPDRRDRTTVNRFAYEQYPDMLQKHMLTQLYETRSVSEKDTNLIVEVLDTSSTASFGVEYDQTARYEAIRYDGGWWYIFATPGGVISSGASCSEGVLCSGEFTAHPGTVYTISCSGNGYGQAYVRTDFRAGSLVAASRIEYDANGYLSYSKVYDGSQWLTTDSVVARDSYGNILESQNIDRVRTTTKWGHNAALPIATISNARDYETKVVLCESFSNQGSLGFVAEGLNHYENTSGGSGTRSYSQSNDAIVGSSQKVVVNYPVGSSAGVNINIGNLDPAKNYVVEFDYKVTEGTLELLSHSESSYRVEATYSLNNQWRHSRVVWVLNGSGTNSQLWWRLPGSGGNLTFFLDNVSIYPSDAFCITTTYNSSTLQTIGQTDANGVSTLYEYDPFGRLVETRNDEGYVVSEGSSFFSRDVHEDFQPSDPNRVTARSLSSGNPIRNASFELGRNGTKPMGWTWNDGCAVTTVGDAETGTNSMKVTANRDDAFVHSYLYKTGFGRKSTTYTVSFWAKRPTVGSSSTEVFLMKVDGSGSYKTWNGAEITVSGTTWTQYTATIVTGSSAEWDNLANKSVIRFDVNTNGHIVYFDDIMVEEGSVLHDPTVSTTFSDGLGRTIQTQVRDGDSSIVSAVEFDAAGRQSKTYFPYKILGHAFDPNFAANASQRYYPSPQIPNPYSEVTYYSDPLNRVRYTKPVGRSIAEEDVERQYGSASLNEQLHQYTDVVQKSGNQLPTMYSRQYFDKLGRVVKSAMLENGTTEVQSSTTLYNMLGKPVRTIDPNGFVDTMAYDFLGRLKYERNVDAGTSRYVYDKAGRLRFMIDSAGVAANPDHILYWKYDIHGRVTEKGYYGDTWNEASLQANAENPSHPPSPSTWRKRYNYDGDGATPYMKGRLDTVFTNNNDDGFGDVIETFQYDKYGRVLSKGQKVLHYNGDNLAVSYEYDHLGRVTEISYPVKQNDTVLTNMTIDYGVHGFQTDGSIVAGPAFTIAPPATVNFEASASITLRPGFTAMQGSYFSARVTGYSEQPLVVTYTYNQLGQVSSVGIPGTPDFFASYTYKPDGRIATESINHNSSTKEYLYRHRRGYLTRTLHPAFKDSLGYDSGGYQGAEYYTGLIASTSYEYGTGGPGGYNYKFKYDELGRLITAANTPADSVSYGVTQPMTYDQNGNMLTKPVWNNPTPFVYSYSPGTNKVQSYRGFQYQYDPNANVTASEGKSLSNILYDPFTQLTMRMTETVNQYHVSLEYGGNKQRVLKSELVGDNPEPNATLYIHGMSDYPLAEKYNEQGSIEDRSYVFGPSGLIAVRDAGTWFFVIKDHLGSTRVVLNSSNVAASWYDYTPFGDVWRSTRNQDVSYQFTGQEYDEQTKLHNFRARLYDSDLGRFYAMDPARQGWGPFSYAGNSPVMYIDKDGRVFFLLPILADIAVGAAIGAGVSAATYSVMATITNSWTWQGFGNAMKFGAISGGIGGGIGSVVQPLIGGGKGLHTAFSILRSAGANAATTALTGGNITAGGIIGGIAGGFVAGQLAPFNGVVGGSAVDNIGTEILDGVGRGIISGGIGGGVSSLVQGENVLNGIGEGAINGAFAGGANAVARIAMFGFVQDPDERNAGANEAGDNDYNVGGYLPNERSGGLYGLVHSIFSPGFTAGDNLLTLNESRRVNLHERMHYYDQIRQGFGSFYIRAAIEQGLSLFGVDVYGTNGYQENWAVERERYYDRTFNR